MDTVMADGGGVSGRMEGLRALVTGGGVGIGRAIADEMTREGATVMVADLDPATRPDVVADCADTADVDRVFATVRERLGGLDVLVNNMGVKGPTGPVEEMDPDAYDECVRINLGSAFRCARRAVPMLRARPGSMLNISSTVGQMGYPYRSPYAAAKWGVIGLTKTWAMELGPQRVRVNAICPGSVDGPRMDRVIADESASRGVSPEVLRETYARQTSMRTFVQTTDIAKAAAWLSSDDARFVSGQVLFVDGHTETSRSTD
jgi:NAD(P)-dependent dehydrogenase (short-subunit alcohol dehydrogenase family)